MRPFSAVFEAPQPIRAHHVLRWTASIFIWHALAFTLWCWVQHRALPWGDNLVAWSLGWSWNTPTELILKNVAAFLIVVAALGIAAAAIWRATRFWQPRHNGSAWFLYSWWMACVTGTVLIPVALLLLSDIFPTATWDVSLLAAYTLFAPAAIAPSVIPTRVHWRPECPECRHHVNRAVVPRCSECGESFPIDRPYYRRWAIQRLPWDRRDRFRLFAYFQTLFTICFFPGWAAWRLANPDRLRRAIQWALAHQLVILALGLLPALVFWVVSPFMASGPQFESADVQMSVSWFACFGFLRALQILLCVVLFPVALSLLLIASAPALSGATRIGMYKWTLYHSFVPIAGVLCTFTLAVLFDLLKWIVPMLRMPSVSEQLSQLIMMAPHLVATFLYIGYAVTWSLGIAMQPFAPRRGCRPFMAACLGWLAAWRILARVFDLRGFELQT